MRELREKGLPYSEIARIVGVAPSTVQRATEDIPFRVGIYTKSLPIGLLNGSIIDIETTGIEVGGSEIITLGCLQNNKTVVYQRADMTADEYHAYLTGKIMELPKPIYAYNAEFERSFLTTKSLVDPELVDIFGPYMKRANKMKIKYPKLDELASIPHHYFGEKSIPSKRIPDLWHNYVHKRDLRSLATIVKHVREDLIQSLYVLVHTPTEELF